MKASPLLLLWLACPAMAANAAEPLSIDWYSVDAGGGTSFTTGLTGTSFTNITLSGTVGQPDAGALIHRGPNCESRFALTGGFWSLVSPYWPEGPHLRLRVTSTNTVLLSWSAMCQDYQLQKTPALGPPNWANVGQAPVVVMDEYQVSLDDFFGCLTLRCEISPGIFEDTFIDCRSGFAFWFGTNAVPPPPNCRYIYSPTNNAFFRLFKP